MKIFKRGLIGVLVFFAIAIGVLYFYKDVLIRKVVEKINKDYNIEIAYNDVDLGVLKSFPNATLTINNLLVKNEKPFEGDTLIYADKVNLVLNIKDVFNKEAEKIHIKNLSLENGKVRLVTDSLGQTNYNIYYLNETNQKSKNSSNNTKEFTFDVKKYQIVNSDFTFNDKQNNFYINIENLNHFGSGDFSASKSDLTTKTDIEKFTLKYGDVSYLNNVKVLLDALIKMDLESMKFTLKENDLKINDLNLKFGGYVQHNKSYEDINLSFQAPKANFKSILSLIPNAYSASFKNVKANGVASIEGYVKGIYSQELMPKYSVDINTKNAFLKYPDLPKSIKKINFKGRFANETVKHQPFLIIDDMQFSIDQDVFSAKGIISNIIVNPKIDASFKGKLNLDNLYKAYPIKLENKITGILKADFHTKVDKKSIENNDYKNIKTNGIASLEKFSYSDNELKTPVFIDKASMKFNANSIKLTDFKAETGSSDVQATGTLDNLYAFLFDDKKLKGNFILSSENFVVSDFLVDEQTDKVDSADTDKKNNDKSLKIPNFLDITTNVKAKRVVYNNLVLKDVSTSMKIIDQRAILKNTKAKMMHGQATFDGVVDTQKTPSEFNFKLNLNKLDIASSFSKIETFQKLAPAAKAIKGKFNSDFSISGKLKNDFTPDLYSLSGKILAQLFVKDVNENANPLLNALTSELSFIDLDKINFDKLKTSVQFKNGKVNVKPFNIIYKDIIIHVKGSHSFDKSLMYQLNLDLPAKYLGKEAQTMLSKLTNVSKDTIKVPLRTLIQGTFDNPIVKANFKQALKELAIKVVKYQKQQLINQASNQVENVIDGVLSNTGIDSVLPIKNDSTKLNPKDIINEGVKDILGGFFDKKKKDTTK
jgi:hypothetical protein